ncbi:MAG: hypothetical protein JNM27_00410 [Leptospirales bacterium]|nr:hypothetical protein [Leptospirales bacterium]
MRPGRKHIRLGIVQALSALIVLVAAHFFVKRFVEATAFSPGFFIYAPGGESLAYEEFEKTSGRKVAFVGNSVMAALDFPRLRKVIKRHYGEDIEAFNFGRPAQGVGDYRVILSRMADLKPDLIVMQIHEISIAGQVFRTNVRGQIANRTVLERVGPELFLDSYGVEGFFQSPLYRLPLYPYRDPFRQTQLQRSIYFGSTLSDVQSRFWRHLFQGSDPFLGTPQDARSKHQEAIPELEPRDKKIKGYGIELNPLQIKLFEDMLEDLKAMGVPYFVYLQPVPPAMADAPTGDFFRQTLRKHNVEFTDIRNDYPESLFTTMAVHMRDSRHMFDLLFATQPAVNVGFSEIDWKEAGLTVAVRSRFDLRSFDEYGMFKQLNIEGDLKRRNYFLFSGDGLINVRPGSPVQMDQKVISDFAAGLPVAIEDEMHFWAPARIMEKLKVIRFEKGPPAADIAALKQLRFYSVSVPVGRISDLFQVSVNGEFIPELDSMEAPMNHGYWLADRATGRVTLILPRGHSVNSVQVSYINQERALGSRLKALIK